MAAGMMILPLCWTYCQVSPLLRWHLCITKRQILLLSSVLVVCFKWLSKRNSLTTHLGMVICTYYLARVYSKLTQGHFLQTFMSFRKCHFTMYVLTNPLDGTVFALAFFESWESTNWHPVSNTHFTCFTWFSLFLSCK